MDELDIDSYLESNADRQLEELKAWLRIPSISCRDDHKEDMHKAARWLGTHLEKIGLQNIEIIPTESHPLVYADWLNAGDGAPTVLVYGHYDVQPEDPKDEWLTPPFEPTVKGDDLFARGTSDDKGQLFIHVKAIEALFRTQGRLPVNIKIIAEGDEESGIPAIANFLSKNRGKLAADVCIVSDTAVISPDQPSITYGLRGGWCFEMVVRGPKNDIHSGIFGGVVHNPAQALAEILAKLHDTDGRVTVPGFYDDIKMPGSKERKKLNRIPRGDKEFLEETGVPRLYGEPGFTAVERIGVRPTLEINGMWGGYIGEGFKTVIPAEARARVSCRLVPGQDPGKIVKMVTRYIKAVTPGTVTLEIIDIFSAGAVVVDIESEAMSAAAEAYTKVFGVEPYFIRDGGGIPIVSHFQQTLKTNVILMGFGLPDDNIHGPNEKIHLPNFYRGIRTSIYFMNRLAAGPDSDG